LTSEQIYKPPRNYTNSKIICIGFPASTNDINYDAPIISQRMTFYQGNYVEPSFLNHCHKVILQEEGSLDGVSGSPVYGIRKIQNNNLWAFYGIMLRETILLDGYILINMLREEHKNNI